MMNANPRKLALVLAGFFAGAIGGAGLTQAATSHAEPVALASHGAPRPSSLVQVHAAALSCGVYGLTGSPAVVVLTAGADGRPVRAAIESDIFGGDEAEGCVLEATAGLPMNRDTLRIVLPVHQVEEVEGPLASR